MKVEVEALTPQNDDGLIFVTPEWISKDENNAKVQTLVDSDMLSDIAIDESTYSISGRSLDALSTS